jgi:hypothetical protein
MIPEGKKAVNEIKDGHSLALDGHSTATKLTLGPRSALLPQARSTPKLPVDTSYESVQENINRKLIHSEILKSDPAVFRRYCGNRLI